MIQLLWDPALEVDGSEWTLVLWVCQAFDDEYSFRDLFAHITARLRTTGEVDLTLPPEEPLEDFVHGTLRWGPFEYGVYFERSLGYVQFSTAVESRARELFGCLQGDLVWPEPEAPPDASSKSGRPC